MLTLAEAAPVERAVVHEVSATVVNKGPISTSPGTGGRAGQGQELDFVSSSLGTRWLCVIRHSPAHCLCFGESLLNMQSLSMFCTALKESCQGNSWAGSTRRGFCQWSRLLELHRDAGID